MGHNTRSSTGCPGYRQAALSRRAFLTAGALGGIGLSLSHYLALRAAAPLTLPSPPGGEGRVRGGPARAKSVLLLYTMGGISHHDSFDPKPDAPAEIRGEFRTIPTCVPGIRFSEYVPRLARMLDQFALIRSVQHNQTDHGVGAYYMLRGYPQPDPSLDRPENQKRANPTIGAHVARLLGSPNGLPPYVCVPGLSYLAQIDYYTAGWMGRAYDPFVLRSDPSLPTFGVPGLTPLADVSPTRLDDRVSLARAIDRHCRLLDASPGAKGLGTHYERAFQVLSASRTRRAFDIAGEPDRVRDRYGRTRLGQGCLLGRRLVEAEVPFVTVDDDGWDHHAQVFPGLKQRLPELDRCLTALLDDLRQRGLLQTTLVAVLTDFGRTPVINKSAGRDHWPGVFSVLFAGAGIRGGQVLGASDKIGAEPREGRVSPKDLAATLYHFLGINPFQEYRSLEGRPHKVLDEGRVIPQLVS
ncbi:MAG: DUF1501 domain-containing protein [Planctomycetes bacterium]|nr:DUF1501 domain-containing protein [Planctomycetota bacterium]